MPSRNWHHKTRHGCAQCKKRHVRCDLGQYTCGNCRKRGQYCDFQHQHQNLESVSPTRSSSAQPATGIAPASQALLLPPSLPVPVSASRLLSIIEGNPEMVAWDPVVVPHVARHPFLQHGFRAVAMLHDQAASPIPRQDGYVQAYGDHIAASAGFRQILKMIDAKTDWIPTILFTLLVVVFEIRLLVLRPDHDSLLGVLSALRSTSGLVNFVAPGFVREREAALAKMQPPTGPTEDSSDRLVAGHCMDLENALLLLDADYVLDETYRDAAQKLKAWLVTVKCQPRSWGHVLWWPSSISEGFIDRVRLREPVPLLLCFYWAYFMSNMPKSWFFGGWLASVPPYVGGLLAADRGFTSAWGTTPTVISPCAPM